MNKESRKIYNELILKISKLVEEAEKELSKNGN